METRNLKKIFISSLIALSLFAILSPSSSLAERGGKRGKRLERIAQRLDLSDSQKEEVKEIFKSTREKYNCRDIDSKKETRECRKKMREEVHTKMESILNEGQLTKFEEHKEEMKDKFGRRGKGNSCDSDKG